MKRARITGLTGQGGAYLAEFLIGSGSIVDSADFDSSSLMPTNLYGPGDNLDPAISNVLRR